MWFIGGSRVGAAGEWRVANGEWNWFLFAIRHSLFAIRPLNPRHIELRLLAGAVAAQRAVFADRIGTLKNPVLPRRQAREDFRFHGLGADEAQVRFHAGEPVRRKAGSLLEKHPHLV